jgi:hypothetical protein
VTSKDWSTLAETSRFVVTAPGGESAARSPLDRFLGRAERHVALVERARPLNAAREHARVLGAWQNGGKQAVELAFSTPPELSEVRRVLASIVERFATEGTWGRLYAARAAELELEAAAAESIGSFAFAELAAKRFRPPEATAASRTLVLAKRHCEPVLPEPDEPKSRSDDERDPRSLIASLRRAVGERRLPFRVSVCADLPCAAATGDGIVLVRPRVAHGPRAVRRIVLHELEGHAVPWVRARAERIGLFALGSAGGADEQEGWALVLEQRSGLLDASRRAELGRRHLAASALRQGASWVETVELLLELGSPLEPAFELATRVHRGGGLGREIVYLPAMERVSAALREQPSLEAWFGRGRLSVAAARALSELDSGFRPAA